MEVKSQILIKINTEDGTFDILVIRSIGNTSEGLERVSESLLSSLAESD